MEIMKTIVSDRNREVTFSHAIAGVLYYNVEGEFGKFQFPVDMNDKADVGTATFDAKIRAITMMRYIRKALNDKTMVQLS